LPSDDADANRKTIAGGIFFSELHNIYSEKFMERLKAHNQATDRHTAVQTLEPQLLRKDFETSVEKCFRYLNNNAKEVLTGNSREYIQERKNIFLSDDAPEFFDVLDEFSEKFDMVLQTTPKSASGGMSGFLQAGISGGAAGAGTGSIIPGFGTIVGGIIGAGKSVLGSAKDLDKGTKSLNEWYALKDKVFKQVNAMWCKLTDLFVNDIFNNIHIDLEEDALGKRDELLEKINGLTVAGKDDSCEVTNDLSIIQQYLWGDIYGIHPNIPPDKMQAAKSTYVKLSANEKILCLQDFTVFEGGQEGICLTTDGIYWKVKFGSNGHVRYININFLRAEKETLWVNGSEIKYYLAPWHFMYAIAELSIAKGNQQLLKNGDLMNDIGINYQNPRYRVVQNHAKAVEWYRKAAEQGNAWAQNNLGWCYKSGKGVELDYIKAVEWYRKSVEQGNAWAQNELGYCYYEGKGVELDYAKAVELFRKSADQGFANGQDSLADCYRYGRGVEQDYAKAIEWYRKAADQGCDASKKNLEELKSEGKI
jgi:hypothetical protein